MQDSRLLQKEITRNTRALRKEVGRNLHTARMEQGITLKKLSKRCGLSMSRIDYLEMGKTEMNLRHVVTLASGLRVSVRDLLAAKE